MNNLLASVMKGFGTSALAVAESLAIEQLTHNDRAGIVRAVQLPDDVEKKILAHTGGDLAAVDRARAAFGNAFADYVLAFLPSQVS